MYIVDYALSLIYEICTTEAMIAGCYYLICYVLKADEALFIYGLLLGWVYLVLLGWEYADKERRDDFEQAEEAANTETKKEKEEDEGNDAKPYHNCS